MATEHPIRLPARIAGESPAVVTSWCVIVGGHALLVKGMVDRSVLAHPLFTGVSRSHLPSLVAELAGPRVAGVEGCRHRARDEAGKRAPGAGARHRLVFVDRLVATLTTCVTTSRTRSCPSFVKWTVPPLGSVHDPTAARTHGIIDALAAAELKCWADKGTRGPATPSASRSAAAPTASP